MSQMTANARDRNHSYSAKRFEAQVQEARQRTDFIGTRDFVLPMNAIASTQ
jgi:hypothetical protein